jgi:hypothetical protein
MGEIMFQFTNRAALLAALCVAAGVLSAPSAMARNWKAAPADVARDYSQILDNRGNGEIVMSWWFSAPMLAGYPDAQAALDKYVIIGVIHAHVATGGTMVFDPDNTVAARDGNGKALTLLTGSAIPPTVGGMLTSLEGMMSQALGQMGQGIRWDVFDAGAVHACGKGGLSVDYAGTTYTYDTPIPGCQPG